MSTLSLPAYYHEALDYLDEWLKHQKLIDQATPGYSVAISYQGNIVFNRAYGWANLERKEPLTTDHLFRIASHSKTFTATAIMQLMGSGKLSIHHPAAQYLPFLHNNPDKRLAEITIQQMLAHASGMARDGENPIFWRLEKPFPLKDEIISFFSTVPLPIDANTRFKYSNYAYALLGWIIENVSGLTYEDYMRKHILIPLGLERIGAEYNAQVGPYITGYSNIAPNGEQVAIQAALSTNKMVGATGFYANAESLCGFYQAVMPGSGQLLSDSLKREMLRQQWYIPDEEQKRGYALGFVCEELSRRSLNGHSGGMPGNITKTLFDKEEGEVISVLTNSHAGKPDMLQKGLWHILDFFKKHHGDYAPYKKFTGHFYDIWGTSYFVPLGNKIYVSNPAMIEPFKDCSELEHQKDSIFRIVRETGYGSYGEDVEFIMSNDAPIKVIYAGYPKYQKGEYLKYLEKLKTLAS